MRDMLGLTEQDPEYVEALTNLANLDLAQMRENTLGSLTDLVKRGFTKPHDLLYYTEYLVKSPLLLLLVKKRREDNCEVFLKWLFDKVKGVWTSRILFFIIEHKATTFLEIITVTKASKQMADYMLKEMTRWGLIESTAYVKSPYIKLKGRAPRVFSTIDATPEDIVEAMRRYAILTLGYDPRKLQDVVTAQNKVNWTGDPIITVYNQYKDTNWTPSELSASFRTLGYSENKLTTAMAKTLKMLNARAPGNYRRTT